MRCERIALMIAHDDNDSLRKEEILAVSKFEGAAIGTKGSGARQQVIGFGQNIIRLQHFFNQIKKIKKYSFPT